jgi:hypothetical protein
MSDTPEFVELVNRLRALLDSEYRRGQADARRRIIEVLGTEVSLSTPPFTSSTPVPAAAGAGSFDFGDAKSAGDKQKRPRAPDGAPDALVTRVLMERGVQGASSTEIETAAASPAEKMVSQSGIRYALDRGRTAGKYRNEYGRWFLVEKN